MPSDKSKNTESRRQRQERIRADPELYARHLEQQRRHNEKRKEARKEYMRAYNASERGKESVKRYRSTDAAKEAWSRYNNSEKGKARWRTYNRSERRRELRRLWAKTTKTNLPLGEFMQRQLQAEPLYVQASKLAPKYLPKDVREDFITEVIIAVLEGSVTIENVSKNITRFIPAHHKDSFKTVSMDQTIAGTDNLKLSDKIASDVFHF
ncbi:hypothetical protein [Ochrobactrum sp. BTU2]|uniref:hypothetical protein n=1 Tax=Ochrobactrum sp. BTU2 TaxID=2856166 RepID=UPI00211AA451|nr:hypothetical protein [Ochrobactrum sp. BTU2]MCQ9146082.1 hypothetical protein [Ochrobactrum sp. BTU2]